MRKPEVKSSQMLWRKRFSSDMNICKKLMSCKPLKETRKTKNRKLMTKLKKHRLKIIQKRKMQVIKIKNQLKKLKIWRLMKRIVKMNKRKRLLKSQSLKMTLWRTCRSSIMKGLISQWPNKVNQCQRIRSESKRSSLLNSKPTYLSLRHIWKQNRSSLIKRKLIWMSKSNHDRACPSSQLRNWSSKSSKSVWPNGISVASRNSSYIRNLKRYHGQSNKLVHSSKRLICVK